jgi:hypothetical protein
MEPGYTIRALIIFDDDSYTPTSESAASDSERFRTIGVVGEKYLDEFLYSLTRQKLAKKIASGQTATIHLQNGDAQMTSGFDHTKPN